MDNDRRNFSFWDHLDELRHCLLSVFFICVIAAVAVFPFSNRILFYISRPVGQLVFLSPAEALVVRLKLSIWLGLLSSLPVWGFQIIRFLWTGLRQRERQVFFILTLAFLLLSLLGILFAVTVLIPASIKILLSFSGPSLQPVMTAQYYTDFYLNILLAVCLLFNTPAVMIMLAWLNIVSVRQFSAYRKYVFIGCLTVSAFMTPPDIVSQTIMALPLYILYEAGLFMIRLIFKKEGKNE